MFDSSPEKARENERPRLFDVTQRITLPTKEAWETFPGEVQEVLVNMLFNLGRPRLTKFKNFNKQILAHEWAAAAPEGRDSIWYRQVGNRAERLMDRLEAL